MVHMVNRPQSDGWTSVRRRDRIVHVPTTAFASFPEPWPPQFPSPLSYRNALLAGFRPSSSSSSAAPVSAPRPAVTHEQPRNEGSDIFSFRGICFRCLAPGHVVRDCRNSVRCIWCRKVGHMAKDCRARVYRPRPRPVNQDSQAPPPPPLVEAAPEMTLTPPLTERPDAAHCSLPINDLMADCNICSYNWMTICVAPPRVSTMLLQWSP